MLLSSCNFRDNRCGCRSSRWPTTSPTSCAVWRYWTRWRIGRWRQCAKSSSRSAPGLCGTAATWLYSSPRWLYRGTVRRDLAPDRPPENTAIAAPGMSKVHKMSLDPARSSSVSQKFSQSQARMALAMPRLCLGAPSTGFSRQYGFSHASNRRIVAPHRAVPGEFPLGRNRDLERSCAERPRPRALPPHRFTPRDAMRHPLSTVEFEPAPPTGPRRPQAP